ncbi:gliding motility-associated C-terminal domain-containing protein [Arenibacter amylolyticus]|uniref:gliding motility-associated C-terminal domain-containing protein n=1 Tax=Arenibacter amylolyticus TaxID=1406873 RepID=UPI000A380EE7|nr:gliding motility-associated C-terminal domain-containing protein [Arenibacter amylolyticus]
MKKAHSIFAILFSLGLQAQTAMYNIGNIRIHQQGQIGFHTNLINNAAFDQNLGLAGFYGNDLLRVSGAFAPTFYDMEIANEQGLQLDTGINVLHNTNFIIGNIITPRPQQDVFLNFLEEADYVGVTDFSKVDGYVTANQVRNFDFPVGDASQLRALDLNSSGINAIVKCAYYRANVAQPSNPFPGFDTSQKLDSIINISTKEFWHLEANLPSTIQISWNPNSDIAALTQNVAHIVPVGWSISQEAWVNLGTTSVVGSLDLGILVSKRFTPSDYAVITFGSVSTTDEAPTLDNYLVTPNGDGVNDFLKLEGLESSKDYMLRIFDRNGLKVYEEKNYTNGFTGYSNINNLVINRDQGLPNGVYFYIVDMKDLNKSHQGYLYLERAR